MALSGGQITGLGATGFPNQAYLGFTAKAESIVNEIVDGIVSLMTADGFGVTGIITADGGGVLSVMAGDGIISAMSDYGGYALSTITSDGDGITSTL